MSLPVWAETLRIATYNAALDRDGPGLLLRDILKGKDAQIDAVVAVIAETAPDILLLQKVDYDYGLVALTALRDRIAELGPRYDYLFALRPNTGWPTGLDMDGNGKLGEARDAQSYGRFSGQGGMAILSRYPIRADEARDFTRMLWRDLPGAQLTLEDGTPLMSEDLASVQRLSYVGHWVVPVEVNDIRMTLLAFHASPPVFDGPEDRNGRRNRDELRFWQMYLDGAFGMPPEGPFVLLGDANLDPSDGDGRREAIRALLADPRLQDPRPMRPLPLTDTRPDHTGDARLDTVNWRTPGPGPKRVDYVLPDAGLRVLGAGVFWPPEGSAMSNIAEAASRHRLVWVDLQLE